MSSPLHRLVAPCALALAFATAPRISGAQVEAPQGNVGVFAQIAQNTGEAGDAYRVVMLGGVNAGYELVGVSKFGFGLTWSLGRGWYRGAADGLPDQSVSVIEMSGGFRVRRLLGETTPRFLAFTAGATALRLSRAVPPDDERLYYGPFVAIGLDQYLGGRLLVSFTIRYGLIATGPGSLGLRIAVSLGS